jgi:hypothetical protein
MDTEIRTGGSGLSSTAIFDLVDYVDSGAVDRNNVLQAQWGSYMTLAFFHRGDYPTRNIIFELMSLPMPDRISLLGEATWDVGGVAVIPVYAGRVGVLPVHAGPSSEIDFAVYGAAITLDGALCVERVFTNRIGETGIVLYRLLAPGPLAEPVPSQCRTAGELTQAWLDTADKARHVSRSQRGDLGPSPIGTVNALWAELTDRAAANLLNRPRTTIER